MISTFKKNKSRTFERGDIVVFTRRPYVKPVDRSITFRTLTKLKKRIIGVAIEKVGRGKSTINVQTEGCVKL